MANGASERLRSKQLRLCDRCGSTPVKGKEERHYLVPKELDEEKMSDLNGVGSVIVRYTGMQH